MSISDEQYISEYLKLLGCGRAAPDLAFLTELHSRHVCRVMFENLALLGDFTPDLSRDFLFDRIVVRRRGGVCYELNTSFYQLLSALGFSCCQISGAVKPGESMFSHVATLVHLPEGDFIADAGFADCVFPPLKLGSACGGAEFQLTDQGNRVVLITRHAAGQEPKRLYEVSLTPRRQEDFFEQFRWASAKGNTVFSKYPICASHSPERRVVLRGGRLTVECAGQIVENRPVAAGNESDRILREYFNLP